VRHDEKKFMKKNLIQEFRNDFQQLATLLLLLFLKCLVQTQGPDPLQIYH